MTSINRCGPTKRATADSVGAGLCQPFGQRATSSTSWATVAPLKNDTGASQDLCYNIINNRQMYCFIHRRKNTFGHAVGFWICPVVTEKHNNKVAHSLLVTNSLLLDLIITALSLTCSFLTVQLACQYDRSDSAHRVYLCMAVQQDQLTEWDVKAHNSLLHRDTSNPLASCCRVGTWTLSRKQKKESSETSTERWPDSDTWL